MLGVAGTINKGKKDRNDKKRTACMREVVVGDVKMLGVMGTNNEGKNR